MIISSTQEFLEIKDNFWITLKGEIIPISTPGDGISHNEWADNYLEDIEYQRDWGDKDWGCSASDILEKMGFIRIQGWGRKNGESYNFSTKKYPNYKQWKVIEDICLVKKEKLPIWSNRYNNFDK